METNIEKKHHALLNQGEENEMDTFGYKEESCRKVLCVIGYIFSFGFLWLLFYWKPEWHVWTHCIPCSLHEADTILLKTTDEFEQFSRKRVTWIQLQDLNISMKTTSTQPVMAHSKSIISKALRKLDLKVKLITVQKIIHVWDHEEQQFRRAGALEDNLTCYDIHSKFGSGLTNEEQNIRREICGSNAIEVDVEPIWKLLFKEVLSPFYAFEACSLALWLAVGFIEYSIAVIIMTLISIIFTVYDLRKESVKLHNLVKSNNSVKVTIRQKNGECKEVESHFLVPGDMIVLTGKRQFLPCDAILLSGGCIVNESMLTGESIPVSKVSLPNNDNTVSWKVHSGEDFKRHVLFCGTEVIQTKSVNQGQVTAVVLRTGFNTAKGDLVRSILYPKPMNFKLYRDAFRFLMILATVAVIGTIYTVVVFVLKGESPTQVVLKALIIITTAVPPALSAALSTGIMYAQRRLKSKGIFCISPQRINVCGRLNIICFDKTGTLTEDGLDLCGVLPSKDNCFQKLHDFTLGEALPWSPLLGALSSCHSLVLIDGILHGDPLDLKMFEGTCWEVKQSCSENKDVTSSNLVVKPSQECSSGPVEGIAVIHQFPFSSSLQRMSVITQEIGQDELVAYMKGAPEMVIKFCREGSVPKGFSSELEFYTMKGFRVIGLAYKVLEKKNVGSDGSFTREDIESDLEFLGLLILENRLKPETKPVLQELSAANIRTVMITGDNLQTAITVAKSSNLVPESSSIILVEAEEPSGLSSAKISWNLVDNQEQTSSDKVSLNINIEGRMVIEEAQGDYHFAMSGKTYQVILQHFQSLLPKLLVNGAIFARMTPGLKTSLIEEFQKLDYYVCMCGDGANDCGALKMAHAGISLSDQEASVASPFTSQTPNIGCIPELIKEGRAALITSFCVFKYMTLYAMIQFVCLLLLYWQVNILSNYQLLVQDVAVTILVCLTMSLNHAYPKLAPYRPPAQLMSPSLLLSIVLHVIFTTAIQVYGFIVVQHQPWYSMHPSSACFFGNTSAGNDSLPLNSTINSPVSHHSGFDLNMSHKSYETTTLWPLTTIHCIIVAFVFSKGKPFRKAIYTNYIFTTVLIVQLGVCIFLLFADINAIYNVMELVCTPTSWRITIFILLIIVFIVSVLAEEFIIENRKLWLLMKKCFNYKSKSQYRKTIRTVEMDKNWPPINRTYCTKPVIRHTCEKAVYSNPAFESIEFVNSVFLSVGFENRPVVIDPLDFLSIATSRKVICVSDISGLKDEFKQCCKKNVQWTYLSEGKSQPHIVEDDNCIVYRSVITPEMKVRFISVQKIKYVWLHSEKRFQKAGALDDVYTCSQIHHRFSLGLSQEEQKLRLNVCGPNAIEVEIVPVWKLLFKEVLNPYYLFQAGSLSLWLAEGYIEYSIVIIVITVLSIILTIYDLRRQSVKLHQLVESNNSSVVTVHTSDTGNEEMESRYLVPGDQIVLTGKRFFLPCDCILMRGSCIVNEGMLTGESIPVTKTPLDNSTDCVSWKVHSGEDYKRHVLYCGTEVIQIMPSGSAPVTAVVLQTGFNTAKGDMVRSILYPKPMNFKLYRDAFRFLMCLIVIAIIGFIYTVVLYAVKGETVRDIVVKSLIAVTVAIPPVLPAALATAIIYAQKRLKKKKIFCISPQRINVCGRINLVCFDKTGTLTEDGLDLWGVVPSSEGRYSPFVPHCESVLIQQSLDRISRLVGRNLIQWHWALPPSVTEIPFNIYVCIQTKCNLFCYLDYTSYLSFEQEMDDSGQEDNCEEVVKKHVILKPGPNSSLDPVNGLAILQQFPFSSSLQRMSVVSQVIGSVEHLIFMKGAPEMVTTFCCPESVPGNFSDELKLYTSKGFRVIGLAYKMIQDTKDMIVNSYTREEVETGLIFIGLLVLENRLKPETIPVLHEMNDALIRTVMITGDNLQTAITVARNSGIIQMNVRVILIETCEPTKGNPASITWKPMEDHNVHATDITPFDIEKQNEKQEKPNYCFAMTGKDYQVILQHFYCLLPKLLLNGAVFARMSPGQKSNLIEEFQKIDYYVAMCGDGANDCGALKVAHAGISLSEQEASVASPFTSHTTNIQCVPELIKEGRAALVSTFAVFKYVTLYAMIQFVCLLFLYWQLMMIGLYQYLIQDVGITILVTLTMSLTQAYPKLAPYRPPAQLISPPLLLSVTFNVLLNIAIQACGFVIVQQQPWYSTSNFSACGNNTEREYSDYEKYETTTLWSLTTISCIIVAFVFSKGKPFRKPIYTNYIFFCLLPIQMGVCIFILFADIERIYVGLQLLCTPTIWRIAIFILLVIFFIVSFIMEEAVIENRRLWLLLKKLFKYHSRSQYRVLYRSLQHDSSWPPMNTTKYAESDSGENPDAFYSNPCFTKDDN
ncbi:putative cation-transporting ATPase 13A4 [Gastrophryne carolinensis]